MVVLQIVFCLILCINQSVSSILLSSEVTNEKILTSKNIPSAEYNALYDFYNSLRGSNWNWRPINSSIPWNFSANANPCADNWQGVSCDCTNPQYCYISELTLSTFNLSGSIPTSIGEWRFLSLLDLSKNNISGEIPYSIANFTG